MLSVLCDVLGCLHCTATLACVQFCVTQNDTSTNVYTVGGRFCGAPPPQTVAAAVRILRSPRFIGVT